MMPKDRQVNHMLVPPMLTSGKGWRVTGTRFYGHGHVHQGLEHEAERKANGDQGPETFFTTVGDAHSTRKQDKVEQHNLSLRTPSRTLR